MDLIERQVAIDAVEFGITYAKAINKSTGEVKELFKEGNKALNEAVERLKELPSAQPEPKWIPVSERLPENDDAVLISHKHGVGKAWWNGRFWSSATKKCYKTVTAWMPLPEPYREEGD